MAFEASLSAVEARAHSAISPSSRRLADLLNVGIQSKILGIVALLSLVALMSAWLGVSGMRAYHDRVATISTLSERALLGEVLDKLVLGVVMDSRGIYMARDKAEAEAYAPGILKRVQLLSDKAADWAKLAEGSQRDAVAEILRRIDEFVRFRTELVRLSREVGLPEARAFGDNDANRSNRKQLNQQLTTMIERESAAIPEIHAELEALYIGRLQWLIGLCLFGIAIGAVLATLLCRRGIVDPLKRMVGCIAAVAGGRLDAEIPSVDRRDEIGQLGRALTMFKTMLARQRDSEHALEELRTTTEEQQRRQLLEMCEMLEADLDGAVAEVLAISSDASVRGEKAASNARAIAAEACSVAASSEQASGHVTSVSQAAEQLSVAGREIAQRAVETAQHASDAVKEVEAASTTVAALNEAAERIGAVVNVISEVAAQTNLLALNATIEAARAGEAGRGFAVVAHEVKALAKTTGEAAEDIGRRIQNICNAAEQSAAVINKIGSAVAGIKDISTAVAAAAETQEATLHNVARKLAEASSGVSTVAHNVTAISGRSAEIEAESHVVSELVNGTNGRVSELRANLVVSLRSSTAGDRRSAEYRRPVAVPARVRCGNETIEGTVLDLSEGGLRFRAKNDEFTASEGQPATIEAGHLGALNATIMAVGKTSIHLRFHQLAQARQDGVLTFLRSVDEADSVLISAAQAAARNIGQAFETAVAQGQISEQKMFDFNYRPIHGSDPEQFATGFTALCDRVLPAIQEPVLSIDPRIVFCAAVDRNAYLPTHNKKFSLPQKPGDSVWNAANCRNRRFFKDSAGMTAGRTTREFLMQTYDRQMGGGVTVTLKEVDVPIKINDRHWGGLRLAFKA